MRNRLGLIVMVSISLSFTLFMQSCEGSSNPPAPESQTATALVKDSVPALLPRYKLSGFLDTLWMTTDSFRLLDKRVTFRFYIEAADTLTLRGWSSDNDVYNATPDVILFNGKPSASAQFGPANYFGNLQLKKSDIKKIILQINATKPIPAYVLFAPQITSTNAGQINYTIMLTSDDPSQPLLVPTKQAIPTGVITNPSPPRKGV